MILYSLILFVIHFDKYCDVNIELQNCVKIGSQTSALVSITALSLVIKLLYLHYYLHLP